MLQPGRRLVDVATHVIAIEVKRWALGPELQALDAGDRLQIQGAGLPHEIWGNKRNEAANSREGNQNGYGGRQRGGQANVSQLLRHWRQNGADNKGQKHRQKALPEVT